MMHSRDDVIEAMARLQERLILDAVHGVGPFLPDHALDKKMLAKGRKWNPFARKWMPLPASPIRGEG